MRKLYEAQNNAMNFLVVEDTDTGLFRVYDWDLSDDDVKDFTARFERGEITDADVCDPELCEWESESEAFKGMFDIHYIANCD